MRNEKPRRLSEEIEKNAKQLELRELNQEVIFEILKRVLENFRRNETGDLTIFVSLDA